MAFEGYMYKTQMTSQLPTTESTNSMATVKWP